MRLWSIHPKYLDRMGLVGQWREALCVQGAILKGGKWKNHPQMKRFMIGDKELQLHSIGYYLSQVWLEAERRGYNFNEEKIIKKSRLQKCLSVTKGQLVYEFHYLQEKLKIRDNKQYNKNNNSLFLEIEGMFEGTVTQFRDCFFDNFTIYNAINFANEQESKIKFNIEPHPLFKVVEGEIESWEKT